MDTPIGVCLCAVLLMDCGFGDGGEGVCMLCEGGKFSPDTSVAPCRRCTQCNLLNRLEKTACSPTSDALCGQCLPGYYELRSMTGEAELPCVPCYNHDTVHKECLLFTAQGSKAGHSIEMLDYDSVQDLSLLFDSADNRNVLRRLGWSLGVPPQVIAHLQGFQDLFQYLRTSTYTLLPQLAQAAALLPNPEVVARIHRAVVNK
ncbi:tumor necrosis factor receptor superfamily member 27-like protein [Lates japonicus]|uniref:Tumor necrosis factor receptor superfamily member 27-like protein n=1 Tax=Lates japonicus TaxID=270547 RepID=A0AAD3NEH6_LATJO|nr:tumor necrosis factor receptor superfamily member 27-like protein [Lates japonicus]